MPVSLTNSRSNPRNRWEGCLRETSGRGTVGLSDEIFGDGRNRCRLRALYSMWRQLPRGDHTFSITIRHEKARDMRGLDRVGAGLLAATGLWLRDLSR
jgi:hypothetical protein